VIDNSTGMVWGGSSTGGINISERGGLAFATGPNLANNKTMRLGLSDAASYAAASNPGLPWAILEVPRRATLTLIHNNIGVQHFPKTWFYTQINGVYTATEN